MPSFAYSIARCWVMIVSRPPLVIIGTAAVTPRIGLRARAAVIVTMLPPVFCANICFLYVTQLSIKQMLAQKTGGSIVTITAALARNPIRGVTAAVPMITKGGLETITQHLAIEYAKDGIRVNAVAPGAVYTPLHRDTPKDVMESLSPMGRPSTVKDITDAVMYLTDAATVTGDILYVDGGAHFGRW